jgi:sulfoxide reductase heme-binding subunit YedZ
MVATAVGPHLFWITSRAAGTAALVLSSAGASVGLLMGGRFVRGKGLDLRALHEALSLATIVALVLHAVSLLGDSFIKANVADISIPFASSYREPYMAVGIVGGWALIILGLSYYARARIGQQRWRFLHRFTAVAWIMGIVHSLGEGTDSGTTWFLAMTAIAVVPATLLLAARWLTEEERAAPRPAAAP